MARVRGAMRIACLSKLSYINVGQVKPVSTGLSPWMTVLMKIVNHTLKLFTCFIEKRKVLWISYVGWGGGIKIFGNTTGFKDVLVYFHQVFSSQTLAKTDNRF